MKLVREFASVLRNLSDALLAALRPHSQFHYEGNSRIAKYQFFIFQRNLWLNNWSRFNEILFSVLALNTACNGSAVSTSNNNFPSSIQEVFDGIFYAAVPKSRRSREKRATRRYGCHAVKKFMTPKDNITVCLNCGNYHLIHTLCGEMATLVIYFYLCTELLLL